MTYVLRCERGLRGQIDDGDTSVALLHFLISIVMLGRLDDSTGSSSAEKLPPVLLKLVRSNGVFAPKRFILDSCYGTKIKSGLG